jgi:hypothetical protein
MDKLLVQMIFVHDRNKWSSYIILKSLSQFRPSISINSLTGEPSISISSDIKIHPDSLDALLELIAVEAKKKWIMINLSANYL